MLVTEGAGVGMGAQNGPYPVYGAAGLLVAILTHAAINEGVQSAARRKEQEDADRVLEPYAEALRAWPSQALCDAALASMPPGSAPKLWQGETPPQSGSWLETTPVFTLAQDEGVLVLDVSIKRQHAQAEPVTESVVRVVSSPHDAADARTYWSADSALRLKSTAAGMLAHALEIATQPLVPATEEMPPMRTHRYLHGKLERTERAQQVAGDCARAVLRNLRGWLLSVPLQAPDGKTCDRRSTF